MFNGGHMTNEQIRESQVKRLLEQREMYADKPDMLDDINECLAKLGWVRFPVAA